MDNEKFVVKEVSEVEQKSKAQVEEKKPEQNILPPLKNTEGKNIVTRFPPAPNGYPHIGHAKAAIISEEYAKMYEGKIILRFEDTNPGTERLEYYAAIKVGMDWLGIKFDDEQHVSDDIPLLYQKAEQLINSNFFFL